MLSGKSHHPVSKYSEGAAGIKLIFFQFLDKLFLCEAGYP